MKIYVAHSRNFDFKNGLYKPIQESSLFKEHSFVFPHDKSSEPFSSKDFFQKDCDMVIAEVSYPSTGLGIELGWANAFNLPIICIYKKGSEVSNSVKAVTQNITEYSNEIDMLENISKSISSNK